MTSFDERLANFLDAIQQQADADAAAGGALRAAGLWSSAMVSDRFFTMPGRRYIRIVYVHRRRLASGELVDLVKDGTWCGVHCFVDKVNGDILKAETWKKPVTKDSRGNIFNSTQPLGYLYEKSPGVVVTPRADR